jgi:hypothetical protein
MSDKELQVHKLVGLSLLYSLTVPPSKARVGAGKPLLPGAPLLVSA